jgi:hypothetical protein
MRNFIKEQTGRKMRLQADLVYFFAMAFAVSIAMVLLIYVFGQLFSGLKASPQVSGNPYAVNALNDGQAAQNNIASAIVVIMMLMPFASVILAFFVASVPIFSIIIFVALPVEMLFVFIEHDIFFSIVSNSFLAPTAAAIPGLITFWSYSGIICLILAVLISIASFAKR